MKRYPRSTHNYRWWWITDTPASWQQRFKLL